MRPTNNEDIENIFFEIAEYFNRALLTYSYSSIVLTLQYRARVIAESDEILLFRRTITITSCLYFDNYTILFFTLN